MTTPSNNDGSAPFRNMLDKMKDSRLKRAASCQGVKAAAERVVATTPAEGTRLPAPAPVDDEVAGTSPEERLARRKAEAKKAREARNAGAAAVTQTVQEFQTYRETQVLSKEKLERVLADEREEHGSADSGVRRLA